MHDPKGQGLSHWIPVANPAVDGEIPADRSILEKNLRALFRTSPAAVRAILEASPRYDLSFCATDEGVPSATIQELLSAPRQLASKRRPLEEAKRWAQTVPIEENAALIIPGFGLGYHLAALAQRVSRSGVLICFEPDLGLIRGVLERVDHTPWIEQSNLVIIHRADEPAIISSSVAGFEGFLASGTKIIEHPISRSRLGDVADAFGKQFVQIIRAVRTNVITTMVQMQTSMHNMCMNLSHYALGEGVADLRNAAKGHPAVLVAAGPSLERNIAELQKPGVRDRVVIIATQTTLKPLLARGIKPHFVTALDYHEVSKRFYEGLTPADVEGVTLVVEPQANAAILDAFPGRVRCLGEEVLDVVLGEKLHRPMGKLPKGATVAHLAYYLARHLGCDPVVLVGQDLGFTDGQYYAGGAQIHNVWASELSPFRTLEMFEWERVKRMGGALRRAKDTSGNDIYTDEQMTTYLVQFERDFLADKERGFKTLDATEGGVAKAHTVDITLRRAMETYAGKPIRWPAGTIDGWTRPEKSPQRVAAIVERLREIRRDVLAMEKLTIQTQETLQKIIAIQADQPKVNKLIAQVEANRDKAIKLEAAFWLTQFMNQAGALRRFKADRAIDIGAAADEMGKQRLQLERDLENMKALRDAADMVGAILEDTIASFTTNVKAYRPSFERNKGQETTQTSADAPKTKTDHAVAAVMIVDPDFSGMGTPRDLATAIAGDNALCWTLRSLAKTKQIRTVILATDQVERVKGLVGTPPDGIRVTIEKADLTAWHAQRRHRRGGRAWCRSAWRGGPAGLSVYDEVTDPVLFSTIAETHKLDAVVAVGCDWALLDPALVDTVVERYREDPEHHKIVFTHAAPGLGTMLFSRQTLAEVAAARSNIGVFATPAAMLGYLPVTPQFDPIARTNCVVAPIAARDAARRCIPDSPAGARAISDCLTELGAGPDCERAVSLLASSERAFDPTEQIVVELTTRRPGGTVLPWEGSKPELDIADAALERAIEQVQTLSSLRPIVVTLAGRGDPLEFTEWARVVARFREAGAAGVHVRTQLASPGLASQLLAAGVDLVSVDLLTFAHETYTRLTGASLWHVAKENIDALAQGRGLAQFIPDLLIVPRMTKCELTLPEMELFYDVWIMQLGAAAIDPVPNAVPGDRFRPLPMPARARERLSSTITGFRADGSIVRVADDRLIGTSKPSVTTQGETKPSATRLQTA